MPLHPLVLILAAALLLVLPAPAPAAAVATNGKTLDLRFPSAPGDSACVSRPIDLAYGVYQWRVSHQFAGSPREDGSDEGWSSLPARTYTWTDCIGHYGKGYQHISYLTWPGGSHSTEPYTITHAVSLTLVRTWFGSTLELK